VLAAAAAALPCTAACAAPALPLAAVAVSCSSAQPRAHSPGHAAGGALLANLISVSHRHVSGGAVDALLVARGAVGQAIDRGELVDGADAAVGGTCRRVVARGAAERDRGGLVSFHHLCSKQVCKRRLELLTAASWRAAQHSRAAGLTRARRRSPASRCAQSRRRRAGRSWRRGRTPGLQAAQGRG